MFLTRGLQRLYSVTIDRSKFRERMTQILVFVTPLFFWGRDVEWRGMIVVGLGVLLRSWAAGHLKKDQKMAYAGPYLLVRHPLYLGSCLLSLGLIISLRSIVAAILLGGATALQYFHTIRHEEENLIKRFPEYRQFLAIAGPLWPKAKGLKLFLQSFTDNSFPRFSIKQYMKNKEFECLLGVAAVFVILFFGQAK
jgi:hypothetical protein